MKKILFTALVALLLGVNCVTASALEKSENISKEDEEIMEYINIYYLIQNGELYSNDYDISNHMYATQIDVELYRQYMSALSNNNARASSGYSKYFNSSKWITRNGVVSLSINFKGSALYPNDLPAANYAVAKTAFQELYKKHKSSSKWKHTASMEAQFLCHHMTIGKLKNPWNLEPHRTETDLGKVIAKGCNP